MLTTNTNKLGTTFPDDFIEYSQTYGSGSGTIIAEGDRGGYDWEIIIAFRPIYHKFVDKCFSRQDAMRKAGSDEVKIGLYLESGGLLPFGAR